MNLGLLGGTFDPPHGGHLAAARAVRDRFALDRIDLVPASQPLHKPDRPMSSPYHRYAMTVLATETETAIAASPIELIRGGVSYAVETLREARRANPESRIFFVLGTDQFAEIGSWREPGAIVGDFDLIVVERPGTSFKDAAQGLPDFVDRAVRDGRIHHAPIDPVNVSSTLIRERVRAGQSIAGLVAPGVDRYIRTQGLYREPEPDLPSTRRFHRA